VFGGGNLKEEKMKDEWKAKTESCYKIIDPKSERKVPGGEINRSRKLEKTIGEQPMRRRTFVPKNFLSGQKSRATSGERFKL